jgi:hypothetical protein
MKPWALLEIICFEIKNTRILKNVCAKPSRLMKMYAAFKKCLRQTFAPDEKCTRPLKNVRAKPLRLKRNVCGL